MFRRDPSHMLALFLLIASVCGAQTNQLQVVFFSEKGCVDCRQVRDFLNRRIVDFYPVEVVKKSINDGDNARKLIRLAEIYGAEEIKSKGAPAVFIDDRAFQGSRDTVLSRIEETVRQKIYTDVVSPLSRLESGAGEDVESLRKKLTLPALVGAAAADAVNPCACAVLTLMLGSILVASRRQRVQRVLMSGFAFSLAVFISYVLMGIGLFSALEFSGLQESVYLVAGILALVVGLWNLKDAVIPEKLPNIEVPKAWREPIGRISAAATSPLGAFFAGFLVSWLLLPCTSGPYVVILGMLGDTATRVEAVFLILLYNLIFILPFIAITLALAFGIARPYQIESWRQSHKRWLHLATAIVMLTLGVVVLFFV